MSDIQSAIADRLERAADRMFNAGLLDEEAKYRSAAASIRAGVSPEEAKSIERQMLNDPQPGILHRLSAVAAQGEYDGPQSVPQSIPDSSSNLQNPGLFTSQLNASTGPSDQQSFSFQPNATPASSQPSTVPFTGQSNIDSFTGQAAADSFTCQPTAAGAADSFSNGVSTTQSNAASDQPWFSPAQPNASPDQLLYTPAQPNASPDQLLYTPAQPNVSPDQLLYTPAQPNVSPDQLLYTPAQPNVSPDQLLYTPAQPNASPDQLLYTPAQPNASPDQLLYTPAQPDASPDAGVPGLTVVHDVPPNAGVYGTQAGDVFLAPNQTDWSVVYAAGQANWGLDVFAGNAAIGQFGTFDFQRDAASNSFFTEYVNASNYAVGVYMNGAGWPLEATQILGQSFALVMSSNAGSASQLYWWTQGWQDAQSGNFASNIPGALWVSGAPLQFGALGQPPTPQGGAIGEYGSLGVGIGSDVLTEVIDWLDMAEEGIYNSYGVPLPVRP
jgi:hypothetical protein